MKIYRSRKAQERIRSTYDWLLDEWGVDITQMDVMTQYGSTHINVFGVKNATPVLLFHGVGDDSALMWIFNAAALAPHFRLYAVDTIGGPGKSVPNENYNRSFDDAVWIDEVLDGLGLEKVHIAGVSHGGYMAQAYAIARPQRVGKVVSMASGVLDRDSEKPMKTMLKIFMPEALIPTRRNARKLLTKLSGKNVAKLIDHPLLVEHFICLMRGFNNMSMSFHKITHFTDEQIDYLRSKVLYMIGEADPFSIHGGKSALIKHQMNARFFDDVGHGINHEIADEINAILIGHFSE